MKKRTLKEWNNKGRLIKKGSKAVGFNESGKALFTKDQTTKGFEKDFEDLEYYRQRLNYNQGNYYFGGDNPDQMDYDLGLCGQY